MARKLGMMAVNGEPQGSSHYSFTFHTLPNSKTKIQEKYQYGFRYGQNDNWRLSRKISMSRELGEILRKNSKVWTRDAKYENIELGTLTSEVEHFSFMLKDLG